ncbi:T9SS type A sorting domain-containing protein [Flavobacterium sp. WC2509]|uniref:T9SS type A sorting domain-containing protein n=1 Tax=Flavobacterium sp. WC2509 TaxID=3461406 RepID=UPI004044DF29
MKKRLLLLIVAVLSSATYVNAQITLPKTWVFANTTDWPTSSTYYAIDRTIQELNLVATDQTVTTPTNPIMITRSVSFSDSFTGTRAYRLNGSSQKADQTAMSATDFLPTFRYLSFTVSGPFTIKIWFTSGAGSGRIIRVSDGTTALAPDMSTANSTDSKIFTANGNYNGKVYISCPNPIASSAGLDIFKIEVTTQTLGTDDFKTDNATNVYSKGKQVFISNIKSTTKVDVYSISGALVKSLQTESDTSFNLNSGVYIAKVKSSEGEKAVKILLE